MDLPQPSQEARRRDDFNSEWLTQHQQVVVAGDNELSVRGQGAG